MTESDTHFGQQVRRKAEFIKPANVIKTKVGFGGLGDDVLAKAQKVLEENKVDFAPLAEMYLMTLNQALESARKIIETTDDHEMTIATMIYPSMQLKANGGMFHYPLVTTLADKVVQFLEVIVKIDRDVIDIIDAFMTTIRATLASQIHDLKHPQGQELLFALDSACRRYFSRHPENYNTR
jgi:hypothetical protein